MSQVILEPSAITQLDALTQPTEVCDLAGRIVGRFVPNAADDFDPRKFYSQIDKTMADAYAGDPTLNSYQHYKTGAKLYFAR